MSDNNNTTLKETLIESMEDAGIAVLAHAAVHPNINHEDIKRSYDDDMIYEIDGDEYLVYTDDEATKCAGDYIIDSLCAFDPDFIMIHTNLPCSAVDIVSGYCNDGCEDANAAIKAMIIDLDGFIENAIKAEGRGFFLSPYNDLEIEICPQLGIFGINLYKYDSLYLYRR